MAENGMRVGSLMVLLKVPKGEDCQGDNGRGEADKHDVTGKSIPPALLSRYGAVIAYLPSLLDSGGKPPVDADTAKLKEHGGKDRDGESDPRDAEQTKVIGHRL